MIYNELKQRGTEDFPIELYHIEKHHTRYEMSAHWHSEIEIVRVLAGTLNVRLNNHLYTAKENEIIFINPETVHQGTPEDCVYECIVFNPDVLPALSSGTVYFIDSLKNHEYLIQEYHTGEHDTFSQAIDALFSALANKSSGYKFKVIGALYHLFGEIIDLHLYTSGSGTPLSADKNVPKLRSVLSYIRSNYSVPITLDDMANAAGMSPKYFCYFFKEMTTKTPVEYLTLYRIEKASRKLIHSDLSVTAIAFACGFNDLSYFIKTFKQIKGITPAKFRKEAIQ
ncbi:MAG: AraC family transcriptional regulator [Ruminococcaceae bacterium]|nr:AraC family transcriptional regulator [Oscillospiraceae bacterium]